jgi:hypothetical protein
LKLQRKTLTLDHLFLLGNGHRVSTGSAFFENQTLAGC